MRGWILLGIAVVVGGCGRGPRISPPGNPPAAGGGHALRLLALGDSYTIGESVDASQRWPVQLAAALRGKGWDFGEPTIIARTGWTTADLSAAMDGADLRGPYDLVGLAIGVNNQFQGRSEDEYRRQFTDLLGRAIHLAGDRPGRVIVLSIPDWGVTPYAKEIGAQGGVVGAEIDRFNGIAKEACGKAGVAFVDVTQLSRERSDLVADDGLHPNGVMYGMWAQMAMRGVGR